jgi:hypothetical protein
MATDESPHPESPNSKRADGDNDWVLEFGRGLGSVARSVVDGLDQLWNTVEAGLASPDRPRLTAKERRRADEDLDELLQRLGELVSSHVGSYSTLADDEAFGQLLTRLYHAHKRARRTRRLGEILARRSADRRPPAPQAPAPAPAPADNPADNEEPAVSLLQDTAPAAAAPAEAEDPLEGILDGIGAEEAPATTGRKKKGTAADEVEDEGTGTENKG